jgi:copper(I)-binding protein
MRTLILLRAIAFSLVFWAAGSATTASAQDYKLGSLEIGNPWARPSTGKTGAAYFTLRNSGATADALTAVEADVAGKVQIHDTTMDGMVMRMRRLDKLSLPAGETVKVAPGGVHIMLIGLKTPLKAGDSFPLKLVFEKAGSIDVTVQVQAQATASPDSASSHEAMPGMDSMH